MPNKRRWTNKELIKAVKTSYSLRQVLILLGLRPTGGNYDQLAKYIKELNLNITHFKGKGWNKGLTYFHPRQELKDLLVKGGTSQSYKLKLRLFRENLKPQQCEECGWAKKSPDGRLPLELEHINGDRHDNRIENLKILCPNCHSLTITYRARNKIKKSATI